MEIKNNQNPFSFFVTVFKMFRVLITGRQWHDYDRCKILNTNKILPKIAVTVQENVFKC